MELTTMKVLQRWWWLLLVALVGGGVIAAAITSSRDDEFRATATLLISQQQTEGVIQLNDLETTQALASTYREIVMLPPVLSAALELGALGPTVLALRERIDIVIPVGTSLLAISVTARSPDQAASTANILADAFIRYNQEAIGSPPGLVGVVAAATPPLSAEPSGRALTVAAAAILATLVAAAVAFLFEARQRVVRTAGEIHAASGVFALGRIESFGRGARRHRLPTVHDSQSRASEGYRAARTGLIHALHLQFDSPPGATMLVTSPAQGDGKSTTVCNLAVAFGLAGYRVLCIDADLRNPQLHEILGLPNQGGLSALLLEEAPALGERVRESPYPNVSLVPAGSPPRNPSELLSGSAMRSILDQARHAYDLVLLDSPPALAVTDAAVVGGLDTPILLVVRAGRTKLDALQEAVMKLHGAGATTLGAILNGASRGGPLYESSDIRRVSPADGGVDPGS